MKTLLLGYSDIARRRVLPALHTTGVENIDIASVSSVAVEWPGCAPPRRFRDYDTAIAESDAAVAYISTVNSLHAELAEKALQRGFHMIIDKRACLTLSDTTRLAELAERRQLCLAEATAYVYHPRIAMVRQVFEQIGSEPSHIVGVFSMPPRPHDNFRHRNTLGGGTLLDLGPYAVTRGRVFFGSPASETVGRRLSWSGDVDTGFSFLAIYPNGRSMVGSFGYTTGYVNRLDILGPGIAVRLERAFSPAANAPTELTVCKDDQTVTTIVPSADSFALFFDDFLHAVSRGDHARFTDRMLTDAREMDLLLHSACPAG